MFVIGMFKAKNINVTIRLAIIKLKYRCIFLVFAPAGAISQPRTHANLICAILSLIFFLPRASSTIRFIADFVSSVSWWSPVIC